MRRTFFIISFTACLLFGLCGRGSLAQQPPHVKGSIPPSIPDATQRRDDDDDQSSPREEMLKSVEIRRSEETYKENLERARETVQLSAEMRDTLKQQSSLGAAELKKLARIEKLARSIRNDAGGGEDDTTLDDPPRSLDAALQRLAEMCEEFRKKVEKTPRHVVSAAVITSANQLIELTRLIKNFGG
jgi:predicted RNase H-like nuclease (RuvC/YqgF family)